MSTPVVEISGPTIWGPLEEASGILIDQQLKLILKASKFDNISLLASFTDEDRGKIESFMRKKLHKIINKDKMEEYYDIYSEKPELFELCGGMAKTLTMIQRGARRLLNNTKKNDSPASSSSFSAPKAVTPVQSFSEPEDLSETILKEKKKLDTNINDYLKENFEGDLSVSSDVKSDGSGSFVGIAACPVPECDVVKTIQIVGKRWSTSNFYTHVKSHSCDPPKTKQSQQLLTSFVIGAKTGTTSPVTRKKGTKLSKCLTRKNTNISLLEEQAVDDPEEREVDGLDESNKSNEGFHLGGGD